MGPALPLGPTGPGLPGPPESPCSPGGPLQKLFRTKSNNSLHAMMRLYLAPLGPRLPNGPGGPVGPGRPRGPSGPGRPCHSEECQSYLRFSGGQKTPWKLQYGASHILCLRLSQEVPCAQVIRVVPTHLVVPALLVCLVRQGRHLHRTCHLKQASFSPRTVSDIHTETYAVPVSPEVQVCRRVRPCLPFQGCPYRQFDQAIRDLLAGPEALQFPAGQ